MAVQSDYRYTLDAGEKHTFDVISFKLTEGLSEPFRLELMLSSFDPNISFSALMDQSSNIKTAKKSSALYCKKIV